MMNMTAIYNLQYDVYNVILAAIITCPVFVFLVQGICVSHPSTHHLGLSFSDYIHGTRFILLSIIFHFPHSILHMTVWRVKDDRNWVKELQLLMTTTTHLECRCLLCNVAVYLYVCLAFYIINRCGDMVTGNAVSCVYASFDVK